MCSLSLINIPLAQLEAQLSVLQEQYSEKVSERRALQEKCEQITVMLKRAEVLTHCLEDEQVYKWQLL